MRKRKFIEDQNINNINNNHNQKIYLKKFDDTKGRCDPIILQEDVIIDNGISYHLFQFIDCYKCQFNKPINYLNLCIECFDNKKVTCSTCLDFTTNYKSIIELHDNGEWSDDDNSSNSSDSSSFNADYNVNPTYINLPDEVYQVVEDAKYCAWRGIHSDKRKIRNEEKEMKEYEKREEIRKFKKKNKNTFVCIHCQPNTFSLFDSF